MSKDKINIWSSILIYLYLALPILIFFIGWLQWYWALSFGILIAFACVRGILTSVRDHSLAIDCPVEIGTMLTALLLIMLWVYLSGIGGYCYQNGDHRYRNAIFRALVEYDWPVVSNDGSRGMIYYIGFWLPTACIGKLFGMEAGYVAQVVWAVVGIFIVYYLICIYRKKVDLLPIAFLILFSGLDYVGTWIIGDGTIDLSLAEHLEWWAVFFQFSSVTTQLFWVFNQAIPAWIATMLIIVQKDSRNMLFLLSLIFLTSTFPFVGLIPIVIYLYISRVFKDRQCWKEIFTIQNIIGVIIIGGITFLYLIRNTSGGQINQDSSMIGLPELASRWLRYLLFYFLEFGIYLCFVCKYHKKNRLLWLIACILIACPFITVGGAQDFCMRASIPALFILMIFCMDVFERIRADGKKYLFAAYCLVLLLGAITSFNEIHRSVKETFWRTAYLQSIRLDDVSIEDNVLVSGNFSGEINGNIFYRYFAKRRD